MNHHKKIMLVVVQRVYIFCQWPVSLSHQSARHIDNEVMLCVHSPAVRHSTELLVVSGVSGPVLRLLHPLWWLHWEQGLHQHQHAPLCRRLCIVHPATDPGSHCFSFTFMFEQECAWLSWRQGNQSWVALSGWSKVYANFWTVINMNLRNFDIITGDAPIGHFLANLDFFLKKMMTE